MVNFWLGTTTLTHGLFELFKNEKLVSLYFYLVDNKYNMTDIWLIQDEVNIAQY